MCGCRWRLHPLPSLTPTLVGRSTSSSVGGSMRSFLTTGMLRHVPILSPALHGVQACLGAAGSRYISRHSNWLLEARSRTLVFAGKFQQSDDVANDIRRVAERQRLGKPSAGFTSRVAAANASG